MLVDDVDPDQLHDTNIHWLELDTVAGKEPIHKAKILDRIEDEIAVQLQDVNVHWLEKAIVVGQDHIRKA